MFTDPEGHARSFRQEGRDENDNLLVYCEECSKVYPVDDSGEEHTLADSYGGDE